MDRGSARELRQPGIPNPEEKKRTTFRGDMRKQVAGRRLRQEALMTEKTYGIVPKSALEKLDSRLCGSEDYRKDAPYCKKTREDINLNDYKKSKYGDYFYFTPLQVQFCTDFNDWYHNINDQGDSCAVVASTAADAEDFEALIEGRRKAAELAAPVKSESEIFEDLMGTLSRSQQRSAGVRERMQAKARELYDEMTRAREAAAKELADLDSRLTARINAGTKMCADVDPKVLKRIALDCKNLLDEHKDVVETRETWKNRLIGLLTAGIYFVLDGRYRRGKDSFRDKWDESKKAGDGFFTRLLKALEAGYAASKPSPAEYTTDGYPAPETIPEIGEPMDAEGYDPLMTEETPVWETTAQEETGIKEPAYDIKPGFNLAKLAHDSEELLYSILELGKNMAGSDLTSVKVIESALQMSYASDQEKFQSIVPILKSDATLQLIEIAGANLDHDFYDEFIPSASSTLTEAAELFSAGKNEEAKTLLLALKESLEPIDDKNRNFSWTLNRLRSIEESAENMLIMPEESSAFRKDLITRLRAMNHDVGNNAASIGGILSMMDTPEMFVDFMKSSRISFNHSMLDSIVHSAVSMNKPEATRRGVEIKIASSVAKLPVPKSIRKDLYRVVFEAIQNGVKYSDPAKSNRSVFVNVKREEESLLFTIRDNGVGMSEEQARLIQEEPGLRFHPELAPGTGNGVRGTILGLSGKNGWDVTYKPRPGEGTTVIVKVDTSRWADESGKGGTGANYTGGSANGEARRFGGVASSGTSAKEHRSTEEKKLLVDSNESDALQNKAITGGNAAVQGAATMVGKGVKTTGGK